MAESLAEVGTVVIANMAEAVQAWTAAMDDDKRRLPVEKQLDQLGHIIRLLPGPDLPQTVVRLAAVAIEIDRSAEDLCAREKEHGSKLAHELRAAIGELRHHVDKGDDVAVEAVLDHLGCYRPDGEQEVAEAA
jgi:hypothetical protein